MNVCPLGPKPVLLSASKPTSRFFSSLSHGALLGISCTRTDSFPAACHHLQEGQLTLKFTVLVLLFFSNLLKSILVSQDFISNTDLSSIPPKLSSTMTPKVSPGPVARPYLLFPFSSNRPVFQAGLLVCALTSSLH